MLTSSYYEGKGFNQYEQSSDFYEKKGTKPKVYNFTNQNCTFISPTHTFPWRET